MQRQFFVSRALLGCLLLLAVAVVLSSQSQASSLAAPVRAFDFVLRWKWLAPDGFWRPVITVNDQFPGPLIEVNEGDNVVLTVHNELMLEQTTVHFHGLTMKGTPFMDGAAFVTQYPIMHMQSFVYNFTATDAGTYWYHAHMALQYCDGLLGPVVVHKKVEPLASLYDEEIVIFLQDWYHTEGRSLATPRPDAAHWLPYALINGASTFNCSNTGEFARWCTHVNQTNFNVKPGMRYRLRIIAGTARVGLRFAVAGHSMTVINRQGTDMKPFVTNELFMSIADRYDVILHADQPIGEYLIRVKITGCDACSADGSVNAQPNLGHDVFATLRYQGATPGSAAPFALYQDAVTVPVAYVDRRVTPLVPVAPPAATKTWALTLTSERFFYPNDVAPHRMWFFNGKMFHPSPVPLLFQAKEGKVFSATEDLIFTAHLGDVVDVIFNTQHNQDHPLHLHGFKFFFLGQGSGIYNASIHRASLNLVNPPLLDSVNAPGMAWTYLRFVADNPGLWLFHCHVDFHHKEEMALAFNIAPELIGGPVSQMDSCVAYDSVLASYQAPVSPTTSPSKPPRSTGSTVALVLLAIVLIAGVFAIPIVVLRMKMKKQNSSAFDGLANVHANGHSVGHSNGHADGHANGHANGHSNGHTNGDVELSETVQNGGSKAH